MIHLLKVISHTFQRIRTDMDQTIEVNRRKRLIRHIKKIEQQEDKLIHLVNEREHYTYSDWDHVTENIAIPLIIANDFILRREVIEDDQDERTGIDFVIVLYNQHYSEEFYTQTYVKDLLNMYEEDYHAVMGAYNSLTFGYKLWYNLFYCNQWVFSKTFILDNIEDITTQFTEDEHSYQRYQTVPIELYEKYIDKLTYINFDDQEIPIWFIKKYIRTYPELIDVSSVYHTENLQEDTFIDFLSYPELSDKKYQDVLWLTVGRYHISEAFIRDNLEHINKIYSKSCWITNGYKSPWMLILQNSIHYNETLFEENIDELINGCPSRMESIFSMNEFSSEFIYQFLNKKYGSILSSDETYTNEIKNILNQKSIESMDDFVEELLNNNKITFEKINRSKYLSLNMIEKYHDHIDFTYICHYNRNITLDFFIHKILQWTPNLILDIATYLQIDKYSEKTINYFIESYYTRYDETEIDLFYSFVHDLMNDDTTYSDKLVFHIRNHKKERENTLDCSKISSLHDPNILYKHSLYSLQRK